MVKSPRIIYHEIMLSTKSGSTLQFALTTIYALHSLEPTKALFESEIIREYERKLIICQPYCKKLSKKWNLIYEKRLYLVINEIVTVPLLIVCCIILLPARFEETCTLMLVGFSIQYSSSFFWNPVTNKLIIPNEREKLR